MVRDHACIFKRAKPFPPTTLEPEIPVMIGFSILEFDSQRSHQGAPNSNQAASAHWTIKEWRIKHVCKSTLQINIHYSSMPPINHSRSPDTVPLRRRTSIRSSCTSQLMHANTAAQGSLHQQLRPVPVLDGEQRLGRPPLSASTLTPRRPQP